MKEKNSPPQIKFLRLRVFLKDLYSMFRGWHFKYSKHIIPESSEVVSKWHKLSEYQLGINWREELGEVNYNRIDNIDLGCRIIDGVILKPGEVFSLQLFLNNCSAEMGFKTGPTVIKNKTSISIGGGLCLVSSVLFNVALLADCKILEKHCHSTDLWGEDRYAALGRDATYVFGRKDLKFMNTHTDDIILKMFTDRDELTLNSSIYSPQPLEYNVEIDQKIIEKLEMKHVPGGDTVQDAYTCGWIVGTTRKIIHDNKNEYTTYKKREKYKPFLS